MNSEPMWRDVTLTLDAKTYHELSLIALEADCTLADLMRRGLAVMKAHSKYKAKFPHMGFVADATKLDVEITNVL